MANRPAFQAGNSQDLARCLMRLTQDAHLLNGLQQQGNEKFSNALA